MRSPAQQVIHAQAAGSRSMSIPCGVWPICCARISASPHQGRLQRRRLRGLHVAARWPPGLRLHGGGGAGAGPRGGHRRGPERRRRERAAAGVSHARRRPMRHLHAGHADGSRRLLARNPAPTEAQVQDALGGVLCRCTGYRKIVEPCCPCPAGTAIDPIAGPRVWSPACPVSMAAANITGSERYGADEWPTTASSARGALAQSPCPFVHRRPCAAARETSGLGCALMPATDIPDRTATAFIRRARTAGAGRRLCRYRVERSRRWRRWSGSTIRHRRIRDSGCRSDGSRCRR